VRGIVARLYDDSELLERIVLVGAGIAPGDGDPSSSEQLGECAHPCAGDADEVDGAMIVCVEKCHAAFAI
jgi:hypothetical protein